MSLYVDKKFVSFLAPKLDKFKQKSEFLWNFRCPYCGDSHKNQYKARGYIFRKKSELFFMCHNCGMSTNLPKLIKQVDTSLYEEYIMEKFKNSTNKAVEKPDFSAFKTTPIVKRKSPLEGLPTIASLYSRHPAKRYLDERKIPKEMYEKIFFSSDFGKLACEVCTDKEKSSLQNEDRIVIPFCDVDGTLLGVQGRAVGKSELKYITIKVSEDSKKVYGLDNVDFEKRIYVVEGPFDSMFLVNSIALMDAQLFRAPLIVGNTNLKYTLVYDNEPRNPEIVKHVRKSIDLGFDVCIWPSNIQEKDINDMILAGYNKSEIQHIIDENTCNGLKAKLRFGEWSKI